MISKFLNAIAVLFICAGVLSLFTELGLTALIACIISAVLFFAIASIIDLLKSIDNNLEMQNKHFLILLNRTQQNYSSTNNKDDNNNPLQ